MTRLEDLTKGALVRGPELIAHLEHRARPVVAPPEISRLAAHGPVISPVQEGTL